MEHVFDALARMHPQSIVDDHALAQALGISVRTVPRWVARGDLPAAARLGGKNVWMAGKVLEHIEAKMDAASKSAARLGVAQQRAKDGLNDLNSGAPTPSCEGFAIGRSARRA